MAYVRNVMGLSHFISPNLCRYQKYARVKPWGTTRKRERSGAVTLSRMRTDVMNVAPTMVGGAVERRATTHTIAPKRGHIGSDGKLSMANLD